MHKLSSYDEAECKKMLEQFVQWHKFPVIHLHRMTLAFNGTICSVLQLERNVDVIQNFDHCCEEGLLFSSYEENTKTVEKEHFHLLMYTSISILFPLLSTLLSTLPHIIPQSYSHFSFFPLTHFFIHS